MSELPNGWSKVCIADVVDKPKQNKPEADEKIIYVDIGSINRERKVIENPQQLTGADAPSRARKRINTDDVLVSLTRPNLNAVAIVPEYLDQQYASTGFDVLKPNSIHPKFLFYLVRTRKFIDAISGKVQGALYPAAKSGDVQSFEFYAPNLEEQKRIADKLDSVLAKVEAAQARLDKIPAILKRFRQSVLAAATSGELTKDFRESNEFGKVVCIGDLTSDIKYGTSKKCDYNNELTPVLRIPNISNGVVEPGDMKYAEFDEKEFDKLRLKTGDILIIRSNGSVDLVGKSALISDEYNGFLYAGYLIRLRLPNYENALPAYINIALQSPQVRKVIELNARSTSGVNNINSKELASLSFPLPAVQEQNEIIARVSKLLGKAEKMERKYLSGKASLDSLTQSILSKAFSGKLS